MLNEKESVSESRHGVSDSVTFTPEGIPLETECSFDKPEKIIVNEEEERAIKKYILDKKEPHYSIIRYLLKSGGIDPDTLEKQLRDCETSTKSLVSENEQST